MQDWETALESSYQQLAGYLIAYVPQILGAVVLLVIGWVIAWLLAKMTTSLVGLLGRFLHKISDSLLSGYKINIKPHYIRLAGRTVFWVVMLFFFAAATSSLGMEFIATWLKEFLIFLPSILAGAVIILSGFLIGNVASSMTVAAAHGAGFRYGHRTGLLVKWTIISIAVVIGLEQLGINIQFITTLVIVQLGVLSFGIALAYGLGSSELVKNLVGSRQANKHLKIGETIQIDDIEGKLLDISQSMLVLETKSGKALIPARRCLESTFHVVQPETHFDSIQRGKK